GDFSIGGTNNYSLTLHSVRIVTNHIDVATGSFIGLVGSSVSFVTNPFNYVTITGSFFLNAINGLNFTIFGSTTVTEALNNLTVTANGILNLTGFDATPASFTLTTQGPQGSGEVATTTFSLSVGAVPGPLLGAGLPGLLAATAALLALARSRRRRAHLA